MTNRFGERHAQRTEAVWTILRQLAIDTLNDPPPGFPGDAEHLKTHFPRGIPEWADLTSEEQVTFGWAFTIHALPHLVAGQRQILAARGDLR